MSQPARRTIAVVTGTRAEFGLLKPVMRAIRDHSALDLNVVVMGAHFLPPQSTVNEVRNEFEIACEIPMQTAGTNTHLADAAALGRGIEKFAAYLARSNAPIVLVLGDRIEAFAAAAAASVGGVHLAHMHGGDRAEGVADEAMRHAITKLAHIHLPATPTSAQRIIAMGEDPQRVIIVGSPAIDALNEFPPLSDQQYEAFGRPQIVVLLHPTGDADDVEFDRAAKLIAAAREAGPILVLHPNHDPGRAGIIRAIESSKVKAAAHLPREQFIGLLRRAKVLVGNSSAGLIEGAAIPITALNLGRRQAGREMPANVIDIPDWNYQTLRQAMATALAQPIHPVPHPYGDGRAGQRTAQALAVLDLDRVPLAKRNTY